MELFSLIGNDGEEFADFTVRIRGEFDTATGVTPQDSGILTTAVMPIECGADT
jgi:hypothetical protein